MALFLIVLGAFTLLALHAATGRRSRVLSLALTIVALGLNPHAPVRPQRRTRRRRAVRH